MRPGGLQSTLQYFLIDLLIIIPSVYKMTGFIITIHRYISYTLPIFSPLSLLLVLYLPFFCSPAYPQIIIFFCVICLPEFVLIDLQCNLQSHPFYTNGISCSSWLNKTPLGLCHIFFIHQDRQVKFQINSIIAIVNDTQ